MTQRQLAYSVSSPPASTPSAPPAALASLHTPSARTRRGPSVKVVVSSASAAGAAAAAAAIHEALAACPWIVEVLTGDSLMSAHSLWFVEQIVDGLVACGLSPERAVQGYRAIWYYTAGEIMVRATAARRRPDDDRPTHRQQVFADLDPGRLPRLARFADRWAPLTAQDTYRDGLRALVDGLLAAG
ncbi:TetR/AcrR family transcriptional regulator C-terminal domain-containing protein [Kitasatospora sp. NPDC058444]|uniref:TetR/AcrR family transcriptional regulator C-terminal domain-containing protein n=1 Tax=Kitasatospora sp. NPDC058444 TaxID=3346504 RepID=UPI003658D716